MTASSTDSLQTVSRMALLAGAAGSLGLMLYHGRHNTHLLITALFIVWVLAPFASLLVADRLSSRWPARVRRTLHMVTLLITLLSLAIYAMDTLRPRQAQAAFYYVAVPPATWLAGAAALGISMLLSKRSPRAGEVDRSSVL